MIKFKPDPYNISYYSELEGDEPFVEEFNKRQKQKWADSGRTPDFEETMWEILIDDYDKRHKDNAKDKTKT